MQLSEDDKDRAIIEVISKLQQRLGENFFQIVDHWEADLCGIGIANPQAHEILVYIGTAHMPEGQYFVELESAPEPGSEMPYQVAGRYESVGFEELVSIVSAHLTTR